MTNSRSRVLLLTPYTGENLGDQAILFQLVDCLRGLRQELEIIGLTQRPADTAAIHRIPCFPASLSASARLRGDWLQKPVAERSAAQVASRKTAPRNSRKNLLLGISGVSGLVTVLRKTPRFARLPLRGSLFLWRAYRILRPGDLLLLAGGGQIDDEWGGAWRYPFTVWLWTRLARIRRCRVAASSVGWGSLRSPLSRYFFRAALRDANYLSYRDPQSIEFAAALGLSTQGSWVPDHALGLLPAAGWLSAPEARADSVGISPIAYGRPGTWPTRDVQSYALYLNAVSRFAAVLTEQGRLVKLFTTSAMDRHAVADMLAAMRGVPGVNMDLVAVEATPSLDKLWTVLGSCGSVVASRLHGVILAHRLAIPTLAISFDRKVEAHLHLAGQQNFCIDIREVHERSLAEKHETLRAIGPHVHGRLKDFVAQCQPPLEMEHRALVALLD